MYGCWLAVEAKTWGHYVTCGMWKRVFVPANGYVPIGKSNILRACYILGISAHVSAPNNNTVCVAALIKCPNTFGSAPSWLKIRDNRPQLFLSF